MEKDRGNSLEILIERLRNIQVNGDQIAAIRTIREKCDKAFLPFAESEIEFIDRSNLDEAAAHILAVHEGAFTLRAQCDSFLGSITLENSDVLPTGPKIIDSFIDCCARIENIYSLRRPDLLRSLEPVL